MRVVLVSCVLLALSSCTSTTGQPASAPPATATATVSPTPEDTGAACARVPVTRGPQVRDGNLVFRVLAVQAPIRSIVGTHAEFEPRGVYVRARVSVRNTDSVFHDVAPDAQRLVDATGHQYEPSVDAMRIKRQPVTVDLGAQNLLEFDAWFDIPKAAVPRTFLARGDGCGREVLLPAARP